jgi:hypothetical protein
MRKLFIHARPKGWSMSDRPARWMTGLAIVGGLLLSGFAAPPPSESGPPSQADRPGVPAADMLRLAAEVRAVGRKLSSVWPGYWPRNQAFIIYTPGEGALLISDEPGPQSFRPFAEPGLPKGLRGRAWYHEGDLGGSIPPFVLGYPLGNGRTALLVRAAPEMKDLSTLIFHEQFHDYQRAAFRGKGGSQFVAPKAIADRVAFAAAAETERRVLAASIAAKSAGKRRALLRQYLALRREREAQLDPEVVAVERQFEALEGTAKFVDRAAAALGSGNGKSLRALLIEGLGDNLVRANQPFLTTWFRARSYSVGAALTYHLRVLDPRGWQAKIEQGAILDEAIATLVEFDSVADKSALAREARIRFGEDAIRAALEPGIRAAEQKEIKSVEEFHALGSYRLVLEIMEPGRGGQPRSMGFASGPGGMTLLAEDHLVLPDPRLVSATFSFGSLTVRERPFMSEAGDTNRYTILLATLPAVNGQAGLPAGEHRFDRLDIKAPGIELDITRPVIVLIDTRAMTIRVPPSE